MQAQGCVCTRVCVHWTPNVPQRYSARTENGLWLSELDALHLPTSGFYRRKTGLMKTVSVSVHCRKQETSGNSRARDLKEGTKYSKIPSRTEGACSDWFSRNSPRAIRTCPHGCLWSSEFKDTHAKLPCGVWKTQLKKSFDPGNPPAPRPHISRPLLSSQNREKG